jgi:hypothetical protein
MLKSRPGCPSSYRLLLCIPSFPHWHWLPLVHPPPAPLCVYCGYLKVLPFLLPKSIPFPVQLSFSSPVSAWDLTHSPMYSVPLYDWYERLVITVPKYCARAGHRQAVCPLRQHRPGIPRSTAITCCPGHPGKKYQQTVQLTDRLQLPHMLFAECFELFANI